MGYPVFLLVCFFVALMGDPGPAHIPHLSLMKEYTFNDGNSKYIPELMDFGRFGFANLFVNPLLH